VTEQYDGKNPASGVTEHSLLLPGLGKQVTGSRALMHALPMLSAYVSKAALFMASLLLFIFAILLMKDGARVLSPLVQHWFHLDHPANSLGFGWLSAYIIMSGSPVAAGALTFLDAGWIDTQQAFLMIAGSRLGASFIVLFVGFLCLLRGRDREKSLSMGLLSLSVTGVTYCLSLFVGLLLLDSGLLADIHPQGEPLMLSLVDWMFNPFLMSLNAYLPQWTLFPCGLILIMFSFNFFERCLPNMTIQESRTGGIVRLAYRPLAMFLLGAGITTISMSVSISLSILVPLNNRGFIRRETVIPYIMGANITTFIDTLLASMLISHPAAFTVVLIEMLSISLVSMFVLVLVYRPYARLQLAFVDRVMGSNQNLIFFMMAIFILPVILLVV